jgi:hypothetical protein
MNHPTYEIKITQDKIGLARFFLYILSSNVAAVDVDKDTEDVRANWLIMIHGDHWTTSDFARYSVHATRSVITVGWPHSGSARMADRSTPP